MSDDDFLLFDDDEDGGENSEHAIDTPSSQDPRAWKILIVDDEPEVHRVTRLALDGFTFADKPLEFLNAYSAKEAQEILQEQKDIAMVLLDVVMETERAGLELARWIREELHNLFVRIVLRTGQPGQAPETEVIANYDINDYKEKTELTSRKLFTLMYSTLRSYRDIMAIDSNRHGLEKIIDASAALFEMHSLQKFTRGALEQLSALLHLNEGAVYGMDDGIAATAENEDRVVIQAGTGAFEKYVGKPLSDAVSEDKYNLLVDHLRKGETELENSHYIGIYNTRTGSNNLLYLSGLEHIEAVDEQLLQVFNRNIGIAFENLHLMNRIEDSEQRMLRILGTRIDARAGIGPTHLDRVAEIACHLGRQTGLGERDLRILKNAAPLHDIGMVNIPDQVINKPDELTEDEREQIQAHASAGYEILAQSEHEVLKAAAIIARGHHERWDGSGYPDGKKGEDIPLFARLTAMADVFDALYCPRVYKKAWPLEEIRRYFRQQRGKQFDPDLTDLLLVHLEELAGLYPDDAQVEQAAES